jgi:hypothetical protein
MKRSSGLTLGLLLAGAVALVGACAGDRHLGPKVSESFDTIFAHQAALREGGPTEMSGEDVDTAMSNVRKMGLRNTTQVGSAPIISLQK